jgi:hypothetical protein
MTRLPGSPAEGTSWRDFGSGLEKLESIRRLLLDEYLPWLETVAFSPVEVAGEVWSPRKVLRRAVWHELYHFKQLGSY